MPTICRHTIMLYIVATPIGNLQDISLRAIKTLKQVDYILAEDTRHSAKLLQKYQIAAKIKSLHQHNERQQTKWAMTMLKQGKDIALISDSGTPLISDPGYLLVNQAHLSGMRVSPIPGACALIAALSSAGLASDSFAFYGFVPKQAKQRIKLFQRLASHTETLIFYVTPRQIKITLKEASRIFGGARPAAVAKELTKRFETIHTASLAELNLWCAEELETVAGEWVLMITGASDIVDDRRQVHLDELLINLLAELPIAQAARIAGKILKINKQHCYQRALQLRESTGSE